MVSGNLIGFRTVSANIEWENTPDVSWIVATPIIDIDTSSSTITGTAVELLYNKIINIVSSNYTLTGSICETLYNRVIGNGIGSYLITGTSVTFLIDRVIGISSGTYLVTGTSVGCIVARALSLGYGIYLLTGKDLDLVDYVMRIPGIIIMLSDKWDYMENSVNIYIIKSNSQSKTYRINIDDAHNILTVSSDTGKIFTVY